MKNKRVTIKDISNTLGVSYGIINKALNNKSGISDEMRTKILKTADELGYRVNKVAQSMARATITIGVVIPTQWNNYFGVMQKGLDNEFEKLIDYNVEKKYYFINNIYSAKDTADALEQCISDEVNGIVLCDVYPTGLEKAFEKLEESSIPIVFIGNSGYESEKYLSSVSVDARISGNMAAELMRLITKDNANIVIFVGNKDNAEHKLKIDSFSDIAAVSDMNIIGVYETQDDETIAERLVDNISANLSSIDGIYIATSNSASICKKLADNDYMPKIITTDINSEIAEFLNRGIVQCTVYQNLEKQGETAVRIMYEYLAEHKTSPKNINIPPLLVMRSNAQLYLCDI